jgi:regulatory protein
VPYGPTGPTPGSAADRVDDADPVDVARAICLRQLTAAPKTRAQLAATLARRGVPDDAAIAVLDRLTDVGLVDDAAFADAWVESRGRGRGLGRRALAHELRTRGVGSDASAAALDRLDPEQELATARSLVARRLPGLRGLAREATARRLAGMLARKGYGPALVARVVNDALAGEVLTDDEPDPPPEGPGHG